MERMSTLDAGFFFVEHKNAPMHLGSLMVFEGPAPAYRDIAGLFAAKLPLVPRYRQVVRTVPRHVFHPAWGRCSRWGPAPPSSSRSRPARPARAAGAGGAHGS
jgi:hypothetical protein